MPGERALLQSRARSVTPRDMKHPHTFAFTSAIALSLALVATAPVQADAPAPSRPTVTVPSGAAPTALRTRDLVVGHGAVAREGQEVEVHYVGVAWSNHHEFDASWNRGQTFRFRLGAHQVIAGWDQGVVGMHVGGRRQLIIPPSLGYGARGAGGAIGPNETLVFVVDLVAVH